MDELKVTQQEHEKMSPMLEELGEAFGAILAATMTLYIKLHGTRKSQRWGDGNVASAMLALKHMFEALEALYEFERRMEDAKAHIDCIDTRPKE